VQAPLSYESIQDRLKRESRSAGLQKMESSFFGDLERHLRGLQEDYLREQSRAPGSGKGTILHDELSNIRHVAEALYEARERKVVARALTAARGGNLDTTNMLKEEVDLAHRLLETLREARRGLLRRPEAALSTPAAPAPDPAPVAPAATASEAPASVEAAPAPASPAPRAAVRVLVRLLESVPPFTASDLRTYTLARGDVVSLPRDAARALTMHGKAVEIRPTA